MKTSRHLRPRSGSAFAPGLGLALILCLLGCAARVGATSVFVNALQFQSIDTRVDTSVGVDTSGRTYVLGTDGNNNALLRKYDQSGAELTFDNGTNQATIAGISPTALAVEPGTTNLYIVGGSQIYRVSANSGQVISSGDAGTTAVSLQSICFFNNSLYVCGGFNSTVSATAFGRTVYPRGNQAGIIFTLAKDNLAAATAAVTYGDTNPGSVNTANSIAVDDNGGIYVAGKLGTGTFVSDVFTSGQFQLDYSHSSTRQITSIGIAESVLASTSDTGTATETYVGSFGEDDIWRVKGVFNVPTSGQVTFTGLVDDGSRLLVDGNDILDTSVYNVTYTNTLLLLAGYHSIDWLAYNRGGPGNASLKISGGGFSAGSYVKPADFTAHQNKGYVMKFAGDLSFLQNAYFTTISAGSTGGEIKELTYSHGWIYGIGYWQGVADNPAINPVDNSSAGSQDIDILKLDTGLQLNARATVKGVANNSGYSITADEAGNAYVTGSYGPYAANFFGSGDPTNQPFTSLSGSSSSIFIAQLDSNFNFKWVTTPASTPPGMNQPVFTFTPQPRVRWNTVLQRVFWSGYLNSGTLFLGNPNVLNEIDGPKSFLAVLDPSGLFTERVYLTVYSAYGNSGTQIQPFGGPQLSTNIVVPSLNTQPIIKGSQVTVSVPSYLYRDLSGADDTLLVSQQGDTAAATRITCTGYSVGENVANGVANTYTFTIGQDTIVTFDWLVEHALNINADFSQTAGSDSPSTPGHIVGLQSLASGNPVPTVEKHWIAENDPVISTIDSYVDDQGYLAVGLPVRYVVTGYDASGPADAVDASHSSTITNFIPFTGNDLVLQVPQFIMTGPANITYHWKLKIGVQVATTAIADSGYPYIQVVSDPGQVIPPVNNKDGAGVGTFYYDENTSLQIGSQANDGTTHLQGWYDGDGTIFPSIGSSTNLTGTFTRTNGIVYASQPVPQLQRPVRVDWDYGARIFDETVYIGDTVTFSTVDPAVLATMQYTQPPVQFQLLSGPTGSTSDDMGMWDPVSKKYYPLRPGQMLTYWSTTSGDSSAQVIVRLTIKYPAVAHYQHIANTPGVQLTPVTNGPVSFNALKYTESTTGATVDQNGNFTATGPGRTVLLFNETTKSGRGGVIVTPRVRVVQSHNWNDNLPATQTAIIGKAITSAYDTAGLGTGYVYFKNARYNASIYDPTKLTGPVIPVNLNPTAGANDQLVVVWYQQSDQILWPYQAVRYQPAWPTTAADGLGRIVIASGFGSESVDTNGQDQIVVPAETIGTNTYPAETVLDPARFQQVQIYNQPDPTQPGFNPNEEHALLAPSLRSASVSPQPMAVYALRDGDLNVTNQDATYTSDPYVLVQFLDTVDNQYKMKVYSIVRADANLNLGDLSYNYDFNQQMMAGEAVIPFYPLPQVIGATPGSGNYGKDGQPNSQICYWKDHNGNAWAVSGNSFFYAYYFYPLLPSFWWPPADGKLPGDFVAFLPDVAGYNKPVFDINKTTGQPFDYTRNDQTPAAQAIYYTTTWPADAPILKVGETLTFAGGEYRSDNPTTYVLNELGDLVAEDTPGLPGVVGFAAGQIVFDTMNPVMNDQASFTSYTARLFPALDERVVSLPVVNFPTSLLPANGRTTVQNGVYIFNQLPASLQKRIFYDPIRAVLGVKGFLNNKSISDSTLTASPPAVYCLEPNVLTSAEKQILDGTVATSPFVDLQGSSFAAAMDALFNLSRNPNQLDQGGDGVDVAYRVGLEQKVIVDPATGQPLLATNSGIITVQRDPTKATPMQALGPGLAMVANPAFLDPNNTNQISFVTVAENNSDSLGSAPVVLHIIKVDKTQRYRGSIMTILSPNVFDENITLRSTGDFGGNADDLVFEWWYRPEDGTTALPPDTQPSPSPWQLFGDPSGNQGLGFYQLTLKGNPSAPEVLLGDTLFYLRYRHKNEVTSGENWLVPQPNGERHVVLGIATNGIPYEWAGAGNSSPQDLNGDGLPDYIPQLAEGWVKRVLTAVNPYESRISDFSVDNPAVYSSIIQQLGAAYTGPVALNSDASVIENVGLIALYQTILETAESLSINSSTPICPPSVSDALQLASTRISDFYTLLGNEAYSDSLDPTIGYTSDSATYGDMAPATLAFQNQVSTRLDEELDLLRGQNANNGSPVYNRLFWNFTGAEGEAAYVMKYNITDVNQDGFIDVNDAMILYPQGHGDAWGHYLTASTMQYDLLRNPFFSWVSRSELISVQGIVLPVDYLDERHFAQNAAAKAQAGAAIVAETYRQKYVADPRGQWQGYLDTDPTQAWGVDEWARRAGQGAFFDWVTANALLPAHDINPNDTGIQQIDRTTVKDIASICGSYNQIQQTMDGVDAGNNPLGLADGALSFEIDPSVNETFFNQMYDKAVVALNNAKATWDNANQLNNEIRQLATESQNFQNMVYDQDLAYRNQLIGIFGTPYPGTIGSGQLYPAGYQGPDLALYNYVAVNDVNDATVPQPSQAYLIALTNQTSGSSATLINGASGSLLSWGIPSDWINKFNLTLFSTTNGTAVTDYTDFSSGANPTVNQLQNMTLPVMAKGYSYVAPASWGQRSATGTLQSKINDMVQAQADLNQAIYDWNNKQTTFINQLTYLNQKYQWDSDITSIQISKAVFDVAANYAVTTLKTASAFSAATGEDVVDLGKDTSDFIPTMTPEIGLSDSAGDALAPARGGIEVGFLAAHLGAQYTATSLDTAATIAGIVQKVADAAFDASVSSLQTKEDLLNQLLLLQNMSQAEADARVAVFTKIQVLTQVGNDYRTLLAQGAQLLQQRTIFNQRTAAQNQQNQYQDITFRFTRNAALAQYGSALDLASKYAYLAASAYDYDLNLSPDDPGSPFTIMADIVSQRSIGLVAYDGSGNNPQIGGGGLAEDLAKLKANYTVLSANMGLSNPQIETTTLSLRSERFRLFGVNSTNASDLAWQQLLQDPQYYKADLWQVPEFLHYCRSFAPQTNGPQPGLVIPLTTKIVSGLNFFGWPLGGGDNAYDPSVYATRIASVGVAFPGYDTVNLSQTPRVYLIPAGADVMTVPNDPNHSWRWYSVVDQVMPTPYPATTANMTDPNWDPSINTVSGSGGALGDIRQFSSFRAYGFSDQTLTASDQAAVGMDSRLLGRSAWNTRWLLIIPGATLNANATTGLQKFINSIKDINLIINSYGYSGN